MANQIRISSSLTAVNDNSVANEGSADGDYTIYNIDAHAGRAYGGYTDNFPAYSSSDICRWTGVVVSDTDGTNGIEDHAWTEATDVTSGNIPASVYAIALEFVSGLGASSAVSLKINLGTDSIVLAIINVGDGVVIPFYAGITPDKIRIYDSAYQNGTNEATVNVLILGV